MPQPSARLLVRALAAPLLALILFPGAAPLAGTALPDSVLASVGERRITVGEYLRQWDRVGLTIVSPEDPPEKQKQEFLDQLINKDLLALAGYDSGFEPTPEQIAALGAIRQSSMRELYYRRQVLDPLSATEVEARRAEELESYGVLARGLTASLEIAYVDSNVKFLSVAFSEMVDGIRERGDTLRLRTAFLFPRMAHEDSARVLANSTQGPFSLGRFWWHWGQIDPGIRRSPTQDDQVTDWIVKMLAQGVMDAEARRAGLDRDSIVETTVGNRRDGFAAEWYYENTVLTAVDTSEAKLREFWSRDPERYYGSPNYQYRNLWYDAQSSADSAIAAGTAGTEWTDLVQNRHPDSANQFQSYQFLQAKTLLLSSPDSTLKAWLAEAEPGQVVGPREIQERWWIYQFVEYKDGRRSNFKEAQLFVLQDFMAEETERVLGQRLVELRVTYAVETNESALARVEVKVAPSFEQGTLPIDNQGDRGTDR